jgi:hypothetical protein
VDTLEAIEQAQLRVAWRARQDRVANCVRAASVDRARDWPDRALYGIGPPRHGDVVYVVAGDHQAIWPVHFGGITDACDRSRADTERSCTGAHAEEL